MRIEEYLQKMGMTPFQFAEKLGVNRSTVSRWLTGARAPSTEIALEIQRVTGGLVSVEDTLAKRMKDYEG